MKMLKQLMPALDFLNIGGARRSNDDASETDVPFNPPMGFALRLQHLMTHTINHRWSNSPVFGILLSISLTRRSGLPSVGFFAALTASPTLSRLELEWVFFKI
jgi:hypothetical protein